jgi:large subunit ribosomal protein L9
MKVLLREHIEKLGERGEIVNVANGYARNFLLPRRLAVAATAANQRQLEVEHERIAKLAAKEREDALALLKSLTDASVTLVATASPEGHLYGSVGPREIAAALTQEGFEVTEHQVKLDDPFKETGVYVVDVELSPDLKAQSRVWIVAE